jgi:hypothetical protein
MDENLIVSSGKLSPFYIKPLVKVHFICIARSHGGKRCVTFESTEISPSYAICIKTSRSLACCAKPLGVDGIEKPHL